MIDILSASLATAQAELRRLVIEGKSTADARAEIVELEKRIAIEECRQAEEADAAQDDYHAAIRAEGHRLARETMAGLNKRLAAFDIDHLKA